MTKQFQHQSPAKLVKMSTHSFFLFFSKRRDISPFCDRKPLRKKIRKNPTDSWTWYRLKCPTHSYNILALTTTVDNFCVFPRDATYPTQQYAQRHMGIWKAIQRKETTPSGVVWSLWLVLDTHTHRYTKTPPSAETRRSPEVVAWFVPIEARYKVCILRHGKSGMVICSTLQVEQIMLLIFIIIELGKKLKISSGHCKMHTNNKNKGLAYYLAISQHMAC